MNNQNNYRKRREECPGRWEQFGIIFYPLLFYQLLSVVLILLARTIFGDSEENYMACQTMMTILSIPVMYFFFLKPDMEKAKPIYFADFIRQQNYNREILVSKGTIILHAVRRSMICAVIAAAIGTGLNNLILMSQLAQKSEAFAEVNESFYAGGFLLAYLCSGILTPILEEIVFRGILYGRMSRFLGSGKAALLSALLFGIIHFNAVQFLFAFLMGLVFAVLLERTGKLYCCIAAHMAVNVLAVVRTGTGLLSTTVDGSLFAGITSAAFLLLGMAFLYFYCLPMIRDLRDRIVWESRLWNMQKKKQNRKDKQG